MARYGDAGKVAAECDVTVAVLGINKSIEREGQDRFTLELPIDQQEFIKELYEAGCRNLQFDDCVWGGMVNPELAVELTGRKGEALEKYKENHPKT